MLIGMASLLLLSCKEKQPAAPTAAAAPAAAVPDLEHLLNEAGSLMEKKQFAEAEKLMVNGLRQTASVQGQNSLQELRQSILNTQQPFHAGKRFYQIPGHTTEPTNDETHE